MAASQDDAAAQFDVAVEGDPEFCVLVDEQDDVDRPEKDTASADAAHNVAVEGGPESLGTSSAPVDEQDNADKHTEDVASDNAAAIEASRNLPRLLTVTLLALVSPLLQISYRYSSYMCNFFRLGVG